MTSVTNLVRRLEAASSAYYNTGKPTMTDEEYDALREELERQAPEHPFLHTIGAVPTAAAGTVVTLPFCMPSLNKIKPGGAVETFRARTAAAASPHWTLSEKLDGISALWYKGRLYLRGDGILGVEVTEQAKFMKGLPETRMAVRGELLVPRGTLAAGVLARSWVNGLLHRKGDARDDLAKVHFVAYEILATKATPLKQYEVLHRDGFETPWFVSTAVLTDDLLAGHLAERREKSAYDTDGIVVAAEVAGAFVPPAPCTTLKNPTTKVAFKMPLASQCAETTVVAVEWNLSAQGILFPRIQMVPVLIGDARIEFVTGHNAKFIVDQKIGPGARIRVRRSGDVIPTIEAVLVPAAEAALPTAPPKWKWQGVHIVLDTAANATGAVPDVPTEMRVAQLVLFAKKMEIAGLGPGSAARLVAAGVRTIGDLLRSPAALLNTTLGQANGTKLAAALTALVPTEAGLMIVSNRLPRGVGERRLEPLFAKEPDPRKWTVARLHPVAGWSADSLAETVAAVAGPYTAWRTTEMTMFPYPILGAAAAAPAALQPAGTVCFTGVRDKALEAEFEAHGWKVVSDVSSKTTLLIVPDAGTETEKVKKALRAKVRILPISLAKTFFPPH